MPGDGWSTTLSLALTVNALLGAGYHLLRVRRGGPRADLTGQAILGVVLLVLALGTLGGSAWARWAALGYGLLYGVIAMPLWIVAVFIPLRPGLVDKAYASVYWIMLGVVVVAALAAG